jgi:hypothetical protein
MVNELIQAMGAGEIGVLEQASTGAYASAQLRRYEPRAEIQRLAASA